MIASRRVGPAGGHKAPGVIPAGKSMAYVVWIHTVSRCSYTLQREGGDGNGDEESPGKEGEKVYQKESTISNLGYESMINTCHHTTKPAFVVLFFKCHQAFVLLS